MDELVWSGGINKNKNWPQCPPKNLFKFLCFSYFIKIKYKKEWIRTNRKMITKNYTLYKKELKFTLSISIFLFFCCWYFLWSNCHVNSFYVSAYAFQMLCVKYCACFGKWLNTRLFYWFYLNWDATIGFLKSVCLFGWLLSSVYRRNWLKVNVFVCFVFVCVSCEMRMCFND